MNIRTLKANEIECRVQTAKETGCSLLLYKDARCDMKLLDEIFTPLGWEREHTIINGSLFCTVRVWDDSKKMWISKQDVGTESNTEKEKGQASDSFKRACSNIGIGRELYTAPFIWINLKQEETYEQKNKKIGVKTKFAVTEIAYNDDKEIIKLVISDQKGQSRHRLGGGKMDATKKNIKLDKTKLQVLIDLADEAKVDKERICRCYKVDSLAELSIEDYTNAINRLKERSK